ncbi:MAG: Disulfide bond reductase DsbH [Chlamydiae bacterium]|nr:Disulfide bond reductase DsbH [Chlamydiota bacterium]
MKQLYTLFFFAFLFMNWSPSVQAETAQNDTISWHTNYEKALQLAKSSNKPILLFFTGTDWCGWCNKLEKEVLDTPEFIAEVADKLIFVKLDFPMHTTLDPLTKKQNEQLQEKYSVRSFPSLVVLDPDQQPIGITGYRAGGGEQYAHHLMKIINEYSAYKQQMRRLGYHNFSGKELKRLYQKAHELGLTEDVNILVSVGVNSDLPHFFLAEKYRIFVNSGQINEEKTTSLKQQLLASDPDNKYLTHYQVAVIDFEACCEDMEKDKIPPSKAVSPLVDYIRKYGAEDTENLWRLNMVISQVFLDKNNFEEALKYAESSYLEAPASIQPDISMAIKNIQMQLQAPN